MAISAGFGSIDVALNPYEVAGQSGVIPGQQTL